MSHLRARDVDDLHAVADEVREVLSERGHKVGVVLEMDEAFAGSPRVESDLLRSLIADGVARGASHVGHHFDRSRGAVELTIATETRLCMFRLRRAEFRKDGSINIPTNRAASWGTLDELTFDLVEQWVLGFTVDSGGALGDLFAAQVLDVASGTPGHLILGPPIMLGARPGDPVTPGFEPRNEGLPGFDGEDEGDDTGYGFNAG